jgi:DNA topoisomerase I
MRRLETVDRHHARQAGLRYCTDEVPGIRRVSAGEQFEFIDARGRRVRDRATLERIRSLVVPPAWTDVWIAPHEDNHLQATGRDARGRKQYRYHPRWRESRDTAKYTGLIAFARVLPRIRRRVSRDLKKAGLPRDKVLAAVVRLLEISMIRVGNDEYARQNGSFGLTTMHDRHAEVRGTTLHFRFRGKSGVLHDIDLESPTLARIVRRCQELPGQELFQYLDDDGRVRDVGSADVNDYLRDVAGQEVSAKDFRTWAGTVLAAQALRELEDFTSVADAKRRICRALERVAARLGNTPAVCRKCYVHPAIIDAYMDRALLRVLPRRGVSSRQLGLHALNADEAAVLALLQAHARRDSAKNGSGKPR